MLEGIAIGISLILILLGLIGSVLPVLPGPPLSFLGLLVLAVFHHFAPPLTVTKVVVLAMITMAVLVLDYVIPLLTAKKYGASKWGIWGSVAGMVAGMFFPPLGIVLGAFIGAMAVEWLVNRQRRQALRAGWGVFVGSLLGTGVKLAVSGVMAYYFVSALL